MLNVTTKVREHVSAGSLDLQAHKNILGEAAPGEEKKVVVVYSYLGKVQSEEVEENDMLRLPK